jgi:hypothetical protein
MKPTCRELLDGGWTNADMELLAARVERVLARHRVHLAQVEDGLGQYETGAAWCEECQSKWPCPTARILDGEGDK